MTERQSDALQLVEDLIEKNKEWWRNESHCKGEMRELGVPDDADATQVCMGDLYRIEKALRAASPSSEPVAWTTRLALDCQQRLGSLAFEVSGQNLWGEKGVALYTSPQPTSKEPK